MPIYEYICKECGEEFDALRAMKDADKPIECANCHSLMTQRIISAFFAQSNGKSVSAGGASSGCGGCSGKSCSSCHS